jgi:hypothetical protein
MNAYLFVQKPAYFKQARLEAIPTPETHRPGLVMIEGNVAIMPA